MKEEKFILDVTCGCRSIWHNKKHPNVLYTDIRIEEKGFVAERTNYEVKPDELQDFRKLSYPDKKFRLVVWDPPHLIRIPQNSWIAKKYGSLQPDTYQDDLTRGFNECWRVLQDYGILVFKWSEEARKRSITVKQLLKWFGREPLFGHVTGSKSRTKWMCFMKIPDQQKPTPFQSYIKEQKVEK